MSKVNQPTTDAVTQGVIVLASASAVSLGQLYQSTSAALAFAAHDAQIARARGEVIQAASTLQGVALLLGLDAATTARAVKRILDS